MTNASDLLARLRNAGPGYQHHMDLIREAADTIDRLTSTGEAPVYRVDWENAPRDGSWVLLLSKGAHADYRIEQRLFWSKHYSIHGLGGCWSDGFVTMSDLDFIGWRFDTSPREGHVEVPVEPTREMLNAIPISLWMGSAAKHVAVWRAMLAALPHNQGETKP